MDFHQEHLTENLRISNLNNLRNSFLWVIAILSLFGCVGRTDTKERSPEFHEINYTEVIGCVPVDSAIYKLNITRDSLIVSISNIYNDYVFYKYKSPLTESQKSKLHNAPEDSVLEYGISMSPLLPVGMYCDSDFYMGLLPELNQSVVSVDSIDWKQLVYEESVFYGWKKILINRDGLVIYQIFPNPDKEGSFRLSAREIDEISDLLYKSNPRGFCEFDNECVTDCYFEQLFVDGHLFMDCYQKPCIFINSYQRLIEYILEVCKENGLVEDL